MSISNPCEGKNCKHLSHLTGRHICRTIYACLLVVFFTLFMFIFSRWGRISNQLNIFLLEQYDITCKPILLGRIHYYWVHKLGTKTLLKHLFEWFTLIIIIWSLEKLCQFLHSHLDHFLGVEIAFCCIEMRVNMLLRLRKVVDQVYIIWVVWGKMMPTSVF